jgi:type IV pilus assembly protein PilB
MLAKSSSNGSKPREKDAFENGLAAPDLEAGDFAPHKAVGCSRCSNGYKGRFAILETMRMSDEVRRLIVARANVMDVKKQALSEGMLTLRRCGMLAAMRGRTTLEEVVRSTMAD